MPPNLGEILSKGPSARLSVVFEGVHSGGRSPLSALIRSGPFRLSAEDTRLLDAAEHICGGDTPGIAQLALAQFGTLLAEMAGHPRLMLGRNQVLQVSREPLSLPLEARLESNGEISLGLSWWRAGGVLNVVRFVGEPRGGG